MNVRHAFRLLRTPDSTAILRSGRGVVESPPSPAFVVLPLVSSEKEDCAAGQGAGTIVLAVSSVLSGWWYRTVTVSPGTRRNLAEVGVGLESRVGTATRR